MKARKIPKYIKMVELDPRSQRVISFSEFSETCKNNFEAGRQRGFTEGYSVGRKEASQRAFGDLAEVWVEVAKHLATANAYARTISEMHSAHRAADDTSMAPKEKPEEREV